MSQKIRQAYSLTKTSISASKRACRLPPFISADRSEFVLEGNNMIGAFAELAQRPFSATAVSTDIFDEVSKSIGEMTASSLADKPPTPEAFGEIYNLFCGYSVEMIRVCAFYHQLNLKKGLQLLDAFVRSNRTSEVFGMALAARAILELGVYANEHLRFTYWFSEKSREMIAALDSDEPEGGMKFMTTFLEILKEPKSSSLYEEVMNAIFGTRVGSSSFGGSKKKPLPLWEEVPIDISLPRAKNIITMFQKRAKRLSQDSENCLGTFSFQLYELLCDIVHPAYIGNILLMDVEASDKGNVLIKTRTRIRQDSDYDWILAICIGAAAHGCGLLAETHGLLEVINSEEG